MSKSFNERLAAAREANGIEIKVKTFDATRLDTHQLSNIAGMEHAKPEKRAACLAELEARAKKG